MPAAHRPRVVVENAHGEAARAQVTALLDAGFDVTICEGPAEHRCPVLDGQPCSLIEAADVVLYDLDLEDDEDRTVLRTVRSRHPDLPIVIEASTASARAHADDLQLVTVTAPYSMEHLAEAVRTAAGSS